MMSTTETARNAGVKFRADKRAVQAFMFLSAPFIGLCAWGIASIIKSQPAYIPVFLLPSLGLVLWIMQCASIRIYVGARWVRMESLISKREIDFSNLSEVTWGRIKGGPQLLIAQRNPTRSIVLQHTAFQEKTLIRIREEILSRCPNVAHNEVTPFRWF